MNPIDAFLLLAAASHFKGRGTQTFVQKVIFCAEDDAAKEAETPFPTFPFFRWDNGPYSKEVANTAQRLADLGFLEAKDGPPTERGRALLDEVRAEVGHYPRAAAALHLVDEYGSRFCRLKLSKVLKQVYARKVDTPRGPMKIEDVPKRTDLIEPREVALLGERERHLVELIGWKLSQSAGEAREEAESPLVDDARADEFLDRYLGS